jgi:hypothetical protein
MGYGEGEQKANIIITMAAIIVIIPPTLSFHQAIIMPDIAVLINASRIVNSKSNLAGSSGKIVPTIKTKK